MITQGGNANYVYFMGLAASAFIAGVVLEYIRAAGERTRRKDWMKWGAKKRSRAKLEQPEPEPEPEYPIPNPIMAGMQIPMPAEKTLLSHVMPKDEKVFSGLRIDVKD